MVTATAYLVDGVGDGTIRQEDDYWSYYSRGQRLNQWYSDLTEKEKEEHRERTIQNEKEYEERRSKPVKPKIQILEEEFDKVRDNLKELSRDLSKHKKEQSEVNSKTSDKLYKITSELDSIKKNISEVVYNSYLDKIKTILYIKNNIIETSLDRVENYKKSYWEEIVSYKIDYNIYRNENDDIILKKNLYYINENAEEKLVGERSFEFDVAYRRFNLHWREHDSDYLNKKQEKRKLELLKEYNMKLEYDKEDRYKSITVEYNLTKKEYDIEEILNLLKL
jgi:hypothetical protein